MHGPSSDGLCVSRSTKVHNGQNKSHQKQFVSDALNKGKVNATFCQMVWLQRCSKTCLCRITKCKWMFQMRWWRTCHCLKNHKNQKKGNCTKQTFSCFLISVDPHSVHSILLQNWNKGMWNKKWAEKRFADTHHNCASVFLWHFGQLNQNNQLDVNCKMWMFTFNGLFQLTT